MVAEATAAEAAVATRVVVAEATTGGADRVAEARIAAVTAARIAALDRPPAAGRMRATAVLRARGVREHRTRGSRIVMEQVRLASIRRLRDHLASESLTDSSTRLAEPTRQRWLRVHMRQRSPLFRALVS
jgi:hypothetical protein